MWKSRWWDEVPRRLHDLVWSRPLSRAAPDLNLSPGGLRDLCGRFGVPLPPPGYWGRLSERRNRQPLPPRPPGVPALVRWGHAHLDLEDVCQPYGTANRALGCCSARYIVNRYNPWDDE